MQIRSSAPGKVILHGDHAVVYGAPALAVAIDRHTYVTITFTHNHICHLRILDLNFLLPHSSLRNLAESFQSRKQSFIPSDQVVDELKRFVADHIESGGPEQAISLTVFFYLFASITRRYPKSRLIQQSFDIVIDSELPIGAGLGSSASFCAATTAAILFATNGSDLTEQDHDDVNQFAFQAERIVHGNPSGVDNFVAVGGGAVLYRIGCEPECVPAPSQQRIIIVDTMIARSTKNLVAKVAEFRQRHPGVVGKMIDAIGEITQEAVQKLKTDSVICPELIQVNQRLLDGLGVSHTAIDQICQLAMQHGMAAKVTGAGGGGCVICIVPGHLDTEQFMIQIRQAGFHPFETTFSSIGIDVRYV